MQIVERENKLRAVGGRTGPTASLSNAQAGPGKASTAHADTASAAGAAAAAAPSDASTDNAHQFDSLQPGRRCVIALAQRQPPAEDTLPNEDTGGRQKARFMAAVLDVDKATARQAVRDCAVFIVPQVSSRITTLSSKKQTR